MGIVYRKDRGREMEKLAGKNKIHTEKYMDRKKIKIKRDIERGTREERPEGDGMGVREKKELIGGKQGSEAEA